MARRPRLFAAGVLYHVIVRGNQRQKTLIVLEDYAGKGSRRCQRIQWLINDISQLAAKQKIRVRSFSGAKVKQTFGEIGCLKQIRNCDSYC